jgi:uncharacterized membrane protein
MELHPVVVHFAIGLVLISIVFDIFAILTGRKSLEDAAIWTIVFGTIAVIVAAVTGIAEAKELSKEGAIPPKAISLLKTHRNIGLLLMLIVPMLAGLRIFAHVKKESFLKIVYIVIAVIIALALAYQGNIGGKLVYKYGLGIETMKGH